MSDVIFLFTDGSVHPQLGVGYGAVLYTKDIYQATETLKKQVKIKRFEDTSSSKLELENLLWGLQLVMSRGYKSIVVYTDSQNVLSLLCRRNRLEGDDYQTKGNKELKNKQLYIDFYHLYDACDIEIIKVKGHQSGKQKSLVDLVFTLVDRASRKALRDEFKK